MWTTLVYSSLFSKIWIEIYTPFDPLPLKVFLTHTHRDVLPLKKCQKDKFHQNSFQGSLYGQHNNRKTSSSKIK